MKRCLPVCIGMLAMLVVVAGVGAQAPDVDSLTILLASPGEGETFYVPVDGFMLSVPISGQVVSYESPLDPATVEVTVEIVDLAGESVQFATSLDERDRFAIWVSVQPPGQPFVSDDPHNIEDCSSCHRWNFDLTMPGEVAKVVVSARAEDGRTGRVERHMQVDAGLHSDLIVHVEGLPAHTESLQVTATTMIYDWRIRTFYGAVGDGQSIVPIERLNHGTLMYEVSMVPQVIDQTRYVTPAQTVIVPGSGQAVPEVTLQAEAQRGTLAGNVVDGVSGESVEATVMAVNLTSGEAHSTRTGEDGSFVLADLPVAEHVLVVRSAGGFHLPRHVDLAETPDTTRRVYLTRAGTAALRGTVTLDGEPLPFAQATVEGLPVAQADPLTGAFELDGVAAEGPITVEITAAGCYGLRFETTERDLGEIVLTLRDDTQVVERGGARLYLPALSKVTIADDSIGLEQGVLWVSNVSSSVGGLPDIRVGDYVLDPAQATFAVERVTNARPRLYVIHDDVQVSDDGQANVRQVTTGQTLVLEGEAGDPVNLVSGSGAVLRTVAGSVSPFERAPSLAERLSSVALSILILLARGSMLVAYGITFGLFPGMILLAAIVYIRQRRSGAVTS